MAERDESPRLADGSATGLWQDVVREAEARAGRTLDESLESYLVFTLLRHQRDEQLGHRIMALDWLQTLERSARWREHGLRDVGDRCLLLAGLYPEQASRRRVGLDYFVDIGRSAYDDLASALRVGLADLFSELARAFTELVRVLLEIRKLSGQWNALEPLQSLALCTERGQIQPEQAQRSFPGAIVIGGSERVQ